MSAAKHLKALGDELDETAQVTQVIITPAVAAGWVAKNVKNRPVRPGLVLTMAQDMAENRWRLNGETIIMSKQGNILDGQHRLLACIKAGVAFRSFVASGVDEEVFATIDSGTSRKFSDVVAILGYPDPSRMSAITRGWWEYERRGKLGTGGREAKATTQQLLDTLLKQSDIFLDSIHGVSRCQKLFHGPTAAWGVTWIVCGLVDATDRDFFFSRLEDGQNLSDGDAIYALRRYLMGENRERATYAENLLLQYLLKGWNKFRNRETTMVLAVQSSEQMPVPI